LKAGFSQSYIQTFQPAAVAVAYGHFLNAALGGCQPTAAASPLACAPGPNQMAVQNNQLGLQVAAGAMVIGNRTEKVLQVTGHDQSSNKQLIGDHARILPLGKM
jgi:hypothetical protein